MAGVVGRGGACRDRGGGVGVRLQDPIPGRPEQIGILLDRNAACTCGGAAHIARERSHRACCEIRPTLSAQQAQEPKSKRLLRSVNVAGECDCQCCCSITSPEELARPTRELAPAVRPMRRLKNLSQEGRRRRMMD